MEKSEVISDHTRSKTNNSGGGAILISSLRVSPQTYNTTTCSAAPQKGCSNYHIPMLAVANDVTATAG